MNADEIVRALRKEDEGWTGDMTLYELHPLINKAADLIESLQAQLAERDAEIARLTEALHKADIDCDNCGHNDGGDCENHDFDCGTCECDCICKSCRDNSNWE